MFINTKVIKNTFGKDVLEIEIIQLFSFQN